MDFLDFEDNRIADIVVEAENGALEPAVAVAQLLEESEVLMELRTSADLGRFLEAQALALARGRAGFDDAPRPFS